MIIGGVDTSFLQSDNADYTTSVAYLVCLDYPSLDILYTDSLTYISQYKYVSGQLGQKECPAYVSLIQRCPSRYRPSIIFVDGFGILHPEEYGSAVRLGEAVQIKTVGVAKKLMKNVVTITSEEISHTSSISSERNRCENSALSSEINCIPLVSIANGSTLGYAWRNTSRFTKHIFISPGYNCTLQEALEWTEKCCMYRIPEPIRQADILSRSFIREFLP